MAQAVKHSLQNIVTKFAIYPLNFLSSVIVARALGVEDRGVYSFMVVLTSFLTPIVSLGFGGGVNYYIAAKKYTPKETSFTVFLFGLLVGLLSAGLITGLWWFQLLGKTATLLTGTSIFILDCALVVASIFFMLSRVLLGDSQFPMQNKLSLVQNITGPFILVVLVAVFGWKLLGCVVSILGFNLILLALTFHFFQKTYQPVFSINTAFFKDCFNYGFKGWWGDMAVRANVRLDQLVLGGVVSATSLGLYAIGVMLNELLWVVPDSVGVVLFTQLAAEKNEDAKLELFYFVHRVLFFSTFILAIFGAIATVFILIPYGYGAQFEGAILPFLILLPGTILYVIQKCTSKLLSGSGHIGATSKSVLIGSLISIALYFTLIPPFGIMGAAVASSIGYSAMSLLSLYYTNTVYKISLYKFFILQKSDIERISRLLGKLQKKPLIS